MCANKQQKPYGQPEAGSHGDREDLQNLKIIMGGRQSRLPDPSAPLGAGPGSDASVASGTGVTVSASLDLLDSLRANQQIDVEARK